MSLSPQEAHERFANLIFGIAKNYVTCVQYNDVAQFALIDQKIVSQSLTTISSLIDALPESSSAPFHQLIEHILMQMYWGFHTLSRYGKQMSSNDYKKGWLNLARSMALIIFVFENWVENPMTGNGLSLLKLRTARNTTCMLNYLNLANNEAECVALGNNDFYYLPVLNTHTNIVLTDFFGNNQTRIALKELVFPIDEKFIDPPSTANGKYWVE